MKVALYQLDFVHGVLKQLLHEAEDFTGFDFTVTSMYRKGDSGVHGQIPLRGIDVRCRDRAIGERIAEYINTRWTYDAGRPKLKCCIYHNVGQGAHLHFQVHDNTRREE